MLNKSRNVLYRVIHNNMRHGKTQYGACDCTSMGKLEHWYKIRCAMSMNKCFINWIDDWGSDWMRNQRGSNCPYDPLYRGNGASNSASLSWFRHWYLILNDMLQIEFFHGVYCSALPGMSPKLQKLTNISFWQPRFFWFWYVFWRIFNLQILKGHAVDFIFFV